MINLASHLFFFNDTATTEIYTLSLHDALPISSKPPKPTYGEWPRTQPRPTWSASTRKKNGRSSSRSSGRSEEHTSELQSQSNLECRLLLEKKKSIINTPNILIIHLILTIHSNQ